MALLRNGPMRSSSPRSSAGDPVAPSRSRTVLLKSSRVSRRAGVRPALSALLLAAQAATVGSTVTPGVPAVPVVAPTPVVPAVPVVAPTPVVPVVPAVPVVAPTPVAPPAPCGVGPAAEPMVPVHPIQATAAMANQPAR